MKAVSVIGEKANTILKEEYVRGFNACKQFVSMWLEEHAYDYISGDIFYDEKMIKDLNKHTEELINKFKES